MKKVVLILICLLCLCSCNRQEDKLFNSVEELNGEDIGCMSGSIFDKLIEEKLPNSRIIYYPSRPELLLALESGKIQGFISDEPVAMLMVAQNDNVTYLSTPVGSVDYGICFSNEAIQARDQLNEYLQKINNNNHLIELQQKWINSNGINQKKADLKLTGENGTLRCVTTPDAAPFSFIADNEEQGFEVEILSEFCYEYGYDMQIDLVTFDALLTSVATNKYDVAFNGIYITPERAKSVNFCTPTYTGWDVVMVRNGNASSSSFNLKDSFYKNFIEEDRYKLLLYGTLITFEISFFSSIFGTLFGLLIYMFSTKRELFRNIADIIQKLTAKLPAVVLLMILFYVIFNKTNINATLVSVIGFSFLFGQTFYGLLKAGVNSIDKGQFEAALALGYDGWKTFFHIIFPQALNTIGDSYISELIALVKNTSIVGYVSVTDVTRASDIIRGRTYEALFPLIVVAVIYYINCTLVSEILRKQMDYYIHWSVRYHDKI